MKLLDYQWSELIASKNLFAIIVMAHLKTKATTKDLTQREQWKWQLVRQLYQRGFTKSEIINLVKFIDKMMTLPPRLQLDFNNKLEQHEKELNMPFLSTIEEMAEERGQIKGAKETCQQNIVDLLENRFGTLPERLIKNLEKIDDLMVLKKLHLNTISVSSLAEFQTLIDVELPKN